MNPRGPIVVTLAGVTCLLLLLLFVQSRKNSRQTASDPPVLAGAWLLRLPAGFTHSVTFEPAGPGRYSLSPRSLNFAGVYELREDRLVMVEPRDRRLTEFVWKLQADGRLTLVAEPDASKTGSSYLGATLVRGEH